MKIYFSSIAILVSCFASSSAQETSVASPHLSLQLEIQRSVDEGIDYLISSQNEDGSWSNPEHPAFTALALTAILRDPNASEVEARISAVEKGFEFLLSCQREDGAIVVESLPNYNTALSITAMVESGNADYIPALREARSWLISSQADYGEKGVHEQGLDGGIGYGSDPTHSDMSNTHLALEALAYSRVLLADTPDGLGGKELDWDAALDFVTHCQNLPETNKQTWVAKEESERGGFVYYPASSKAGDVEGATNGAQRSYGSMSYAGLLSFIYAEVEQDDPRVEAVIEWLSAHYTLEENPRMDMQGYFYYLHTMAKGLRAAQIDELTTPDGVTHDWRQELALELMERQNSEGTWLNEESNRWMEDNLVLVTSYAVLALEHIHATL